MSLGYIKNLAARTIKEWIEDDAHTYSAALAFYFVLSLPALLLFTVSIGSFFLKSKQLQEKIIEDMQGLVDQSIIDMINSLFENTPEADFLSLGAIIGFLLLLWTASNVFRQLKSFLEKAWNIEPLEPKTIKDFIKDAVISFFIVIGLGGLFVFSIIIEGVLYAASSLLRGFIPISPLSQYAGSISSFLILVLFFMLVYRVLPDSKLALKPVFLGSLVTVFLISIGKYAMGLYLGYSNPVSIYGAIGSITGLFLLIYYSSIMITIGAEFTNVYSESRTDS
ncbi:MAG: YihY/virulence factor BrkB family protein [Euryarchaeota archaeon]|nr:YihY/virulence factor BrkB family protein [Euryarchaeota archaeon]